MSDRDTAGGSTYPPGSFGDAMQSFDPAAGTARGTGEGPSFGGATGGSATERAQEVAGQAQEKATQAVDAAKQKAGEFGDQATTKGDAGMDKAAEGLSSLAGTLRERGEGMEGQGGAAGALQTATTTAADRIEGAAQFLREKDTDQLLTELEALVRRRPTESLLVAVGVGFLLSKALR